MFTKKTFLSNGVRLTYAEWGNNGSPMLLLPGYTATWDEFTPMLPLLVDHYHVFSLTYRGHGSSDRTPGEYHVENFLKDAMNFVKEVLPGPAIFISFSAGALTALKLADRMPDKVLGVIAGDPPLFIGTHLDFLRRKEVQQGFAFMRDLAAMPVEELLPKLEELGTPPEEVDDLLRLDPETLMYHAEGRAEEFFDGYIDPDYAAIQCPVLFIQGNPKKGAMITDDELERVLSVNKRFSSFRIDEVGHSLGYNEENLQYYKDELIRFLEEL